MPTNNEVARLTDFLEIMKTVVPAFSKNTSDQVVVTMLAEMLIQQLLRKGITEQDLGLAIADYATAIEASVKNISKHLREKFGRDHPTVKLLGFIEAFRHDY